MQSSEISAKVALVQSCKDSVWVVIDDKVYDLTRWQHRHPGGARVLEAMSGKDATDVFYAYHKSIRSQIDPFCVGPLSCATVLKATGSEVLGYRALRERLEADGLFKSNIFWFARLALCLFALFALAVGMTLSINATSDWAHVVLSAALLGLFWQQTAFIAHDLCHSGVTQDRETDTTIASLGETLLGISQAWWKHTHNVHHVVTNSVEGDPDIQHLPVFAVDEKLIHGFFSKHHCRIFPFDRVARFFVSFQEYSYYPLMAVARINLYVQSVLMLVKIIRDKNVSKKHYLDLAAMLGFFLWTGALLWSLPSNSSRLVYFIVSHAVSGLVHVQITLSHFAMPTNSDFENPAAKYNFVLTQLDHTLDIDCHPWLDWFHGGLQFQVVHHLFPRIPRHNLRRVRDEYLRPYFAKYNLKYITMDFISANKKVMENLRVTAEKAANLPSLHKAQDAKLTKRLE